MPIRDGTNPLGSLLTLGPVLGGNPRTFRHHALEDRILHLVRQFNLLDAHIDNLDPELLDLRVTMNRQAVHHFRPLTRDHLLNGAIVKLELQAVLDDLQQAQCRLAFVTGKGRVIGRWILDAPFHKEIHRDILFLTGEKPFRARVQRQDAFVKLADIIEKQRFHKMQTGLVFRIYDFTQLELDGHLPLINNKNRGR